MEHTPSAVDAGHVQFVNDVQPRIRLLRLARTLAISSALSNLSFSASLLGLRVQVFWFVTDGRLRIAARQTFVAKAIFRRISEDVQFITGVPVLGLLPSTFFIGIAWSVAWRPARIESRRCVLPPPSAVDRGSSGRPGRIVQVQRSLSTRQYACSQHNDAGLLTKMSAVRSVLLGCLDVFSLAGVTFLVPSADGNSLMSRNGFFEPGPADARPGLMASPGTRVRKGLLEARRGDGPRSTRGMSAISAHY
jgi:hypothetical protein